MAAAEQQFVTYRAMLVSDLASVMEIETRAYAFPWSVGIFRDCLTAGYDCRVLCLNEKIVGHAVLSIAAGEAHLLNICVQREQQGQGSGTGFCVACGIERAAAIRDAGVLYLEVRPSNKKAIRLYESIGFAPDWCAQGLLSWRSGQGRRSGISLADHLGNS